MNSSSRKLSGTLRSHPFTSHSLFAASVSCVTLLASSQAHSSDSQENRRTAGSARAAVAGDTVARIETVIVTAHKREENLQDVPMASQPSMRTRLSSRLVGADDYLRGVPGVNQTNR